MSETPQFGLFTDVKGEKHIYKVHKSGEYIKIIDTLPHEGELKEDFKASYLINMIKENIIYNDRIFYYTSAVVNEMSKIRKLYTLTELLNDEYKKGKNTPKIKDFY